jgi:outer membrane protein assembly factor BamB
VNAPPAIVDGLVYAASDDGYLHALAAADGKELWSFKTASAPHAASVLGGVVYTSDGDGVVYALDAKSGAERWRSAGGVGGSDTTAADGALFVSTQDGALVALDAATGAQRWRYVPPAGTGNLRNPATAGGLVFVAGETNGFFAIDAVTGAQRWSFDTAGDSTGTAVVAGGIAYVGSSGDGPSHLHALDAATGAERWHTVEDLFSPAVAGAVAYAGSGNGLVSARDTATGKELWHFQVEGEARPGAIAGSLFFVPADTEHRIYALDAASGREVWQFDVDGGIDGSLSVTGGSVYVGTTLGGVYAIGGDGSSTIAAVPSATASAPSSTATPSSSSALVVATGANAATFAWAARGGGQGVNIPAAMALDPQDRLWVADVGNSRFALFNLDGTFVEYWGTKGSGVGQFELQHGDFLNGSVAFAPDGSFYVLDIGNRRVQHFDKSRRFQNAWGTFGPGPGQFIEPIAIAVDRTGRVHVLDDVRGVVETYDTTGRVVASFDPHLAGSNSANAMTLDDAGNVYISACCTARNEVRKYDPNGQQVATIGSPGNGPGQFSDQPGGLRVDPAGRIFVVGRTGSDDFVQIFSPDGAPLARFAKNGTGDGEVSFGASLALDGKGGVYITDVGSLAGSGGVDRVEKFQLATPFAEASAPAAAAEFVWSATAEGLTFPNGMSIDPRDRLWVADTGNSRFAIFTKDGKFVEYWGKKGQGDGEFDLQRPNGDGYGDIEFAPDGSFYVLDAGNRQVDHFDKDRKFLKSWGGFGTGPGQFVDLIGLVVDGKGLVHTLDDARGVVETYDANGKLLSSFAVQPAGANTANALAVDSTGDTFVNSCCTAGNQIRKFDSTGKLLLTMGPAGGGQFVDQPSGIDVDSSGRAFVSVGHDIVVFASNGAIVAQWSGAGTTKLDFPFGVLLDGKGNLYVADAGQNQVLKFHLLMG